MKKNLRHMIPIQRLAPMWTLNTAIKHRVTSGQLDG
jgi:hypothetical protein